MDVRGLTERAAKAAGIRGRWGEIIKIGEDPIDMTDLFFIDDDENCAVWNPLQDDGDALRLAVTLQMQVLIHGDWAEVLSDGIQFSATDSCYSSDRCMHETTRRAIVLAAAAIGRLEL